MEFKSSNLKHNEKVVTLDINVLNLVLTPLTCASLISEIIKCLIYEKSLIPYPYNWLKNIVNEYRKRTSECNNHNNILVEKQNHVAAAAYDAVENITGNIKKLFKFGNNIREVVILIGVTPLNPKEVYKFNIPNLAFGHNESNHYNLLSKFQPKVLRSVILSQEWMNKMEQSVPLLNMFVFLKIHDGNSFMLDNNTLDYFFPSSAFFIPKSAQSLTINLINDQDIVHNCCTNLTVYQDNNEEVRSNFNYNDDSSSEKSELFEVKGEWLQAISVLKGFKETFNTAKLQKS